MEKFKKSSLNELKHMTISMNITRSSFSDQGDRREQQDSCLALERICIIADGNDSYRGHVDLEKLRTGADAAKTVTHSAKLNLANIMSLSNPDEESGKTYLNSIIKDSRTMINRLSEKKVDEKKVGDGQKIATTFVGTFIDKEGCLNYTHLGDSPLLLYREGKLYRLTEDDNGGWFTLKDDEVIKKESAYDFEHFIIEDEGKYLNHGMANILSDFISDSEPAKPEEVKVRKLRLKENDTLLLCSDGLSGQLVASSMENILSKYINSSNEVNKELLDECNEELAGTAYSNARDYGKSSDNITIILSHINSIAELIPKKDLDKKVEEMTSEISDLNTRILELESNQVEGIVEIEGAEGIESYVSEEEELEITIAEVPKDYLEERKQLRSELDLLTEELDQSRSKFKNLIEEYETAISERDQLKTKVGEYELESAKTRNLDRQIENLTEDKSVLQTRNSELINKIGSLGQTTQDLREKEEKLSLALKEAEKKCTAIEERYLEEKQVFDDKYSNDIREVGEKVIRLEEELAAYRESGAEKEFFSKVPVESEKGYELVIDDLKEDIKVRENRLESYDRKISRLERENIKLKEKIKDYKWPFLRKHKRQVIKSVIGTAIATAITMAATYTHSHYNINSEAHFIPDIPGMIESINRPTVLEYLAESEELINRYKKGDEHPKGAASLDDIKSFIDETPETYGNARGDFEDFEAQSNRLNVLYDHAVSKQKN